MESMMSGLVNQCPNNLSGVPGHLFMTLISSLFASQCMLGSKDPYPDDYGGNLSDGEEFDFIVVGAGSAGSVVADRLSQDGKWRVLILEAGTYPSATSDVPSLMFSLQKTAEDWQYKSEPSDRSGLGLKNGVGNWPRGKLLGGSSSINAMLYVRGNKKDYNDWEKSGNPGWGYDEVVHHFQQVEKLQARDMEEFELGTEGSLPLTTYVHREPIRDAMLKAAEEMHYPKPSESEYRGFYESPMNIASGLRANAAKMFLGNGKNRPNLKVALNTHVEKIIIDPDTYETRGVNVNIDERQLTLLAKKEVIISAGSIGSPHLLMLSGVGPKEQLESFGIRVLQNLDVGENLQDHLVHWGYAITLSETAFRPFTQQEVINDLYSYFMFRQGEMGKVRTTNIIGFANTKNDSIYPDVQFLHLLCPKNDAYLLPEILKSLEFKEEISDSILEANKKSGFTFIVPALLKPKSTGKISLKNEDPYEKPIIHTGFLTDREGEDIETILRGIRLMDKFVQTPSMQAFRPELIKINLPKCEQFDFGSDDYWKCSIRHLGVSIYHPVGTCKMGDRNTGGVVDHRLRVHGVKNLRVIDASIMPSITSGNTNAPSMMIGHKGATMILEDHKSEKDEL